MWAECQSEAEGDGGVGENVVLNHAPSTTSGKTIHRVLDESIDGLAYPG